MNRDGIVLAALAALVVGVLMDRCHAGDVREWEDRVERVQEHARGLQRKYEAAIDRADSLEEGSRESASEAGENEAEREARMDTVRITTPAELRDHPAILARDSIIDEQAAVLAETREVLEADTVPPVEALRSPLARSAALGRLANVELRVALADAIARGDSLGAVLEDRPGERPWYLPRLGIGVTGGLDSDRKPNTVAGVTAMWEVSF
jgi:hypothetical protein